MNHSDFYRKFEDRHRGDRSLIKERLKAYLPFILPLKALQSEFKVLDLGCGRGEWLELLRDQGVEAMGIDLDLGMLEACKERGLHAEEGDAIEALQALPSGSISLVSGFHIAEHLPFDSLLSLVEEAYRILQPGGLLILETPNPENLVVAAHNFYVDPTHQRPLPPVLLDFTTEYGGFERSRILRLQENEALSRSDEPGFWDVVSGASPDYSVIAQKAGPDSLMQSIDVPFYADQGLKPETIALRYDKRISMRLSNLDQQLPNTQQLIECIERSFEGFEERLQIMMVKKDLGTDLTASMALLTQKEKDLAASNALLTQKEKDLAASNALLAQKEKDLAASNALLELKEKALEENNAFLLEHMARFERVAQVLETKASESSVAIAAYRDTIQALTLQLESTQHQAMESHHALDKLKRSTSWRVTAPLRGLRKAINRVRMLLKHLLGGIFLFVLLGLLLPLSPFLLIALPLILRRPRLRHQIGQRLKHHPTLLKISRLALRIMAPGSPPPRHEGEETTNVIEEDSLAPNHETNLGVDLGGDRDPVLGNLSRQIYIRLKYSHQSPAG